ncbi:hypothetical protein ACNOYE_35225 [Nannocystaceae bacterium ST9]
MRTKVLLGRWIAALSCSLLACSTGWRAEYHEPSDSKAPTTAPASPSADAPFVKVHTTDGQVYVLDDWRFDEQAKRIHGQGRHYSAERATIGDGEHDIAYDQVALIETNKPERVTHATSLAIMGIAAGTVGGLGIVCAVNPKACFGSCPTFYVDTPDQQVELRAEGFSSAVASALEERDVDHLAVVDPPAGRFDLHMANEALETHFVRSVELLSVARPTRDAEVFHTRAGFLGVQDRQAPTRCAALAGDCLTAVTQADASEYSSTTDGEDLAARELIELEFPSRAAGSELALVIRARNTLLDTFLFYQGLAYMGAEAPRWILRADREGVDGPLVALLRGFDAALGDIEVELWDGARWQAAGTMREFGPIAWETQAVELPTLAQTGPLRVRLRLTRGRWKLDQISLGEGLGPLHARVIEPSALSHDGAPDPEGLATLLDPDRRLISYPGDVWTMRFELPEGPQTLFLATTGYYWEWMREEWMAEQDMLEAARFFADPQATLRRLAPVFQAMEDQLEPVFWQTRIKPNLPVRGEVQP